jgi:hypothetical protein
MRHRRHARTAAVGSTSVSASCARLIAHTFHTTVAIKTTPADMSLKIEGGRSMIMSVAARRQPREQEESRTCPH